MDFASSINSQACAGYLTLEAKQERYAQTVPDTQRVGQALLRRLQRGAAGSPVLRELPQVSVPSAASMWPLWEQRHDGMAAAERPGPDRQPCSGT